MLNRLLKSLLALPPCRRWLVFVGTSFLAAMSIYTYAGHLDYVKMHTIPTGLHAFDLKGPVPTCGRWRDHMPRERAPETYRTYIQARNFWRSRKEYEFTRQELQRILNDVTMAAEKGDWGARALLSHFHLTGLGHLDTNKILDADPDKGVQIVRQAVAAGQAWGYYDLGVAHEFGYGGAAMDEAISWAYYRKAAELGSPEAQMALAEAYESAHRKEAALYLRTCAYKQGHGPAARFFARDAELHGDFATALRYLQDGTMFGNQDSAAALMLFFQPENWKYARERDLIKWRELKLNPDADRSKRYENLYDALELNPDLKFKLLDKALPLPPAELPPWAGIESAIESETDTPPTY